VVTKDNNRENEENRRKAFLDALNKRDLEEVKELLRSGIDVDAPLNDFGWTALHVAVENYYLDLALLVLEHGADPRRGDFSGITSLHLAIDIDADVAPQRPPIDGKRAVPTQDMAVLLLRHCAWCAAS
jgi:ankyrin repeat protein